MNEEEIKLKIRNYLYYEIVRKDKWMGQGRYYISIIDLILGIIWFPFFVCKKLFTIKILK